MPATAVAGTGLLLLVKHEQLQAPSSALLWVRAAGLVLTLGALPFLDDPSARQVGAVPLPFTLRIAIRLAGFAGMVLLPVLALAALAQLPVLALLLETSAIAALACAASVHLTRWTDNPEPSTVVSSGLLPLPAVLLMLPTRAALLVPQGSQWSAAHQRWGALLVIGLAALAVTLREPAAGLIRHPPRG